MLPSHILSSNSTGKIIQMAIKSQPLGLCSWNFWNFLFSMRLSNDKYFKNFQIFDLKVHSVSIPALRISLAILSHFVWISSKNFSFFLFFNVSHKSLSFVTWNLIEYLHIEDFQRAMTHLNVWTKILLFGFMYGCKQHTKISWQNWRGNLGNLLFALHSPPHFKPLLY